MDKTFRRCGYEGCTMPSYMIQSSGFCSKCERRQSTRADDRAATGSFLSKGTRPIESPPRQRASVSVPRNFQSRENSTFYGSGFAAGQAPQVRAVNGSGSSFRDGVREPDRASGPRPSISFKEPPPKQIECRTPSCGSASYLIQGNGFCTACNTKAKLHSRLMKLQAGSLDRTRDTTPRSGLLPGPSVRPISPPIQAQAAVRQPLQEEGSAFGGRLKYNFVKKDSSGPTSSLSRSISPGARKAVVDYQFLRLVSHPTLQSNISSIDSSLPLINAPVCCCFDLFLILLGRNFF